MLKRFVEGYALAHHTTPAKLMRAVLAEWAYERVDHTPSKRVGHTLHRLDLLSKRLQLRVAVVGSEGIVVHAVGHVMVPGREKAAKTAPPTPPKVDTVKEREEIYWMVVEMLKEAMKLSENEALAKKAGSRMDAMMVAANLARVGEAILAGYDRAYIQPYLDEMVKLIEQLKEQIRETDQKGKENPTGSAA